MTSNKIPPVGRDRPFPWSCIECDADEVYPLPTDYTMTAKHDEQVYTLRIPDLAIPTCRNCGDQLFSAAVDDRIVAALRVQAGLLAPEEILKGRTELGLSEHELAQRLGVSAETLSRWEEGTIQSRAMDNLLRLYFGCSEARDFLCDLHQPGEPVAASGR